MSVFDGQSPRFVLVSCHKQIKDFLSGRYNESDEVQFLRQPVDGQRERGIPYLLVSGKEISH